MKIQKRTSIAATGFVIMLFSCIIYCWSVFSIPIAAEFPNWSKLQLSFTFTAAMLMFCIGSLAGGFLKGKLNIRYYLYISGLMFFAGLIIASRTHSILTLYLGFGVLCGFAAGFVYNGVMSTVGSWYPEKQGFISGLLLMSYGVGSFFVGKLFQELTPNAIGAWRTTLFFIGLFLMLILFSCSFFISAPGKDFVEPETKDNKKHFINPISIDADVKKMVTKKSFWLYYSWAAIMALVGLAIVSQASFIAKEVGKTVSPGSIATVVGLISIFSGLGRLSAGFLFDKYGRRLTMRIVDIGFIITSVLLFTAIVTNNFTFIILGFILCGFSYGGVPSASSAFTAYYFGRDNYPLNFSLLNTNLMISSFGSTIAGALYDASHTYLTTCYFMAGITIIGFTISFSIAVHGKKVEKKYADLGKKVE